MSLIECSPDQTTINPEQLHALHQRGKPVELIDVRTPAEYRSLHAAIARVVPLDELNPGKIMESRLGAKDEPLYVICRSGVRGEKARERFLAAGYPNVVNVAGGTLAWDKAGLPVVRGRWMLPLDRQVQTTAGTMAVSGFLLGELVDPNWFLLAGFVGCGLLFAGLSGFCPLGWVLARMPWNQGSRDQKCCAPR
jgi:rhodanese-related sulfurtransferase